MSALNVVTFMICLATLAICVVIARRVRWRAALLYLLVGLMPLGQLMLLVKDKLGWRPAFPSVLTDIGEFMVSVLFLLAMILVRQDAARQSNSEARLRLSESLLCSNSAPVEKQLETDLRISELSKTLNRAPSSSAAKN